MHAGLEQLGRVRVAQVVKAALEAGLLENPAAGTSEAGRPPRPAVGAGEDEVVAVEARASVQARLVLRLAVPTQGVSGDLRQGEGPGTARRLRLADATGGPLPFPGSGPPSL